MNDPLHEIPPSVPTQPEGYGKPDALMKTMPDGVRVLAHSYQCGKCGMEYQSIAAAADCCPSPGKLYGAKLTNGLLDLSEIPQEVQDAERTLYKYFSRRGDEWRFGNVASRELIERVEAAKYPQQIALLHRQLKEERSAHSQEEQKLEKRIEALSDEVQEAYSRAAAARMALEDANTRPTAWLFALMIAASLAMIGAIVTGYFQ